MRYIQRQVAVAAYSPLGNRPPPRQPTVPYQLHASDTPAQFLLPLVLAWLVWIPKSTHRERIEERADFRLQPIGDPDGPRSMRSTEPGGPRRALERPWWLIGTPFRCRRLSNSRWLTLSARRRSGTCRGTPWLPAGPSGPQLYVLRRYGAEQLVAWAMWLVPRRR